MTSRLSPEKNLWLYSLTDELKDSEVKQKLLKEYKGKEKDKLYSAVMQVIITANKKQFRGRENMCDALMEIVNEACGELIEERREEWMEEGIKKGREEGSKLEKISLIKRLIENMKVSTDQAMNIIGIPGEERAMYKEML